MSLEIENKYVLLPGNEGNIIDWIHRQAEISHYLICQYYSESGTRYRMVVDGITENRTFYRTVKIETNVPGVFREDESEISEHDYVYNQQYKVSDILEKRRYVFPAEHFTRWQLIKAALGWGPKQRHWEVDVYLGMNLITAEIEHADVSQLGQILPPARTRPVNVTGQRQWSNFRLATVGMPATGPVGNKGIVC